MKDRVNRLTGIQGWEGSGRKSAGENRSDTNNNSCHLFLLFADRMLGFIHVIMELFPSFPKALQATSSFPFYSLCREYAAWILHNPNLIHERNSASFKNKIMHVFLLYLLRLCYPLTKYIAKILSRAKIL